MGLILVIRTPTTLSNCRWVRTRLRLLMSRCSRSNSMRVKLDGGTVEQDLTPGNVDNQIAYQRLVVRSWDLLALEDGLDARHQFVVADGG